MSRALRIMGGASALVGVLVLASVLLRPAPESIDTNGQWPRSADPPRGFEASLQSERSAPSAQQTDAPVREARNAQPPLPPDDRGAPAIVPTVSMPEIAEDVQLASPEVAGHIAEAERNLASQGKDPLRSTAMEIRIFSEISQKALGLEVIDLQVDCRITLCRVQFVLPKSFLQKKFGDIPRDAAWTGREPASFFIRALDLEWQYTTAFGGLDRYGAPVMLGYVAMPLPAPQISAP